MKPETLRKLEKLWWASVCLQLFIFFLAILNIISSVTAIVLICAVWVAPTIIVREIKRGIKQ